MEPGPYTIALANITREACANAVRYGKPPVSVYLEIIGRKAGLWIRDRGSGFDLEQIPKDRHGVRDSILGRTERLGGTATVKSNSNGTEIHVELEEP
ncbi:MAG: hypothetical protein Q4A71_02475 [Actinomycetaceae bacterium]|nr:hypothetical protein [Actinomycetaceae bacterium]